ncbi:MAG: hypothetical protein IIY46_09970 [Lachnospiraceae bacterium]|nr:hypothetical protein [Lachnospiraceae bacterium]
MIRILFAGLVPALTPVLQAERENRNADAEHEGHDTDHDISERAVCGEDASAHPDPCHLRRRQRAARRQSGRKQQNDKNAQGAADRSGKTHFILLSFLHKFRCASVHRRDPFVIRTHL